MSKSATPKQRFHTLYWLAAGWTQHYRRLISTRVFTEAELEHMPRDLRLGLWGLCKIIEAVPAFFQCVARTGEAT